ncbi:MAG: SRPBCC family protein [Candidatus Eremiobacteraeota bacterium]|nr:SRPBCC family protein [Candidatus Eremiobacteraeota bacterium]
MAVVSLERTDVARLGALARSLDVATPAHETFARICEVEKWPVWLSFVKSARRLDTGPIELGSEVALRGAIPGEPEELYEVDRFLNGHIMSLVGAYSIRRRIDFRVEGKSNSSRVVVRVDYPAYGGVIGTLVDRMTVRPRLDAALADSLVHFKGLVEFGNNEEGVLQDF